MLCNLNLHFFAFFKSIHAIRHFLKILAVEVGFEPTEAVKPRQFSRLVH